MASLVEQAFQAHVDSLAPHDRLAQCAAMFHWSRQLVERQLIAELGSLPAERLKWEVAKRMYGGDAAALTLIDRVLMERQLADVSGWSFSE